MDLSLISTLATFSNKNDANPLKVNDNFSEVKSKVNNGFSDIETAVNSNDDDISTLQTDLANHINSNLHLEQGTKALFCQPAAPAGWTKETSVNDRMLRVVSGDTGGQTGGSWTFSGLSITVGGHAITVDEMPPHDHPINHGPQNHDEPTDAVGNTYSWKGSYQTDVIQSTGGGSPHDHPSSYTHDGNWRPSYVDVIMCSKN